MTADNNRPSAVSLTEFHRGYIRLYPLFGFALRAVSDQYDSP